MSDANKKDPGRQLAALPAPPIWNAEYLSQTHINQAATIRARIAAIYQSLCSPTFLNYISGVAGATERVNHLKSRLESLDRELAAVPTINVALLGPSRHGKSSLLNALAQIDILPTSDIKPCTASIVSLRRSEQWGFEIVFIDRRRLLAERKQAIDDSYQYLERVNNRIELSESADDPQYIHSTLQRFIQLFAIDPRLPPLELVKCIENAEIPPQVQRLLGQKATPASTDLPEMRRVVEKYLSTKDVYWTIVDSCEISGPFSDWHPNLKLVDVPGTNDTDPHRTTITNSLRKTAKAVAICTSDSNLGPDLQSWLRNSSVLTDFIEASEKSRQHLFILRTKFDAFHPQIDESQIDENDEAAEDKLMQEAIATHKRKQTDSFREMLRNIATPLLPIGGNVEERQKREEMVARIDSINVFFVSALAHESFAGRAKVAARTKRQLSEHFHDDPEATGIPELKRFANQLAEEYLHKYFFEDIERQLRTEVDLLVRFFRQQWTTLSAELSGGSHAIAELVKHLEQRVIPTLQANLDKGIDSFRVSSKAFSGKISEQLRITQARLKDKLQVRQGGWKALHWNTLRAAGRKNGVHVTYNGNHIDFNNEICNLFLDNVSLSWTTFRDTIVQHGVEQLVEKISTSLQDEIDAAAINADTPEATEAIDAIASNLSTIARSHRDNLTREVSKSIQELESIRQPAYDSVQKLMTPVYQSMVIEVGAGCQKRMLEKLIHGSDAKLSQMWSSVSSMVELSVTRLRDSVLDQLHNFGRSASAELRSATNRLTEIGKVSHRARLIAELESIRKSAALVWESLQSISRTIVYHPVNQESHASNQAEIIDVEFETSSKSITDSKLVGSSQRDANERISENRENDIQREVDAGNARFASGYSWLIESPIYLVQKTNAGRATPDESQVLLILDTLKSNGMRMTVTAIGEHSGLPVFRLRGLLASLQRILNIDGQQILILDRASDTVELNDATLRQEFLT
jgi:Dynamin family